MGSRLSLKSAQRKLERVELVYAVPDHLLPAPQDGLIPFDPALYDLLKTAGAFYPRTPLETDPTQRQITPYAVVRYAGRVLLLKRLRGGTDARLHDRHTIGVGGHLNPVDATLTDLIQAGLERELREELEMAVVRQRILGFIHQGGATVARYHTGVLYLVESATEPRVLETHKLEGRLVTLDELRLSRDTLEGWSLVALDCL